MEIVAVAGSSWDKLVKSFFKDEVEGEKSERRAFSFNQRWPSDEAAKAELLQRAHKEEIRC